MRTKDEGEGGPGEVEDFLLDHLAVVTLELDGEASAAGPPEIGRPILVAEGVAADDDRRRPARPELVGVSPATRRPGHRAPPPRAGQAISARRS